MDKTKHLYRIIWFIIVSTGIVLFLPFFFFSELIAGNNKSIRENISAQGDIVFILYQPLQILL